jgi:diguanylate cyclase (GGDEF)-like protein
MKYATAPPSSTSAGQARVRRAVLGAISLPYLPSARGESLSPRVQGHLVATLYAQPGALIAGGSAMIALSIAEWTRTGSHIWGGWLVAALILLAWRWRAARVFAARRTEAGPRIWARRFTIGAWLNGAWWGGGTLALFIQGADPVAQWMMIAVQAGYLGGAAIRNNASPAAALGQVYLTLVPLLVGCLASGDLYYSLFSLFVVQHILASVMLVKFMSQTTTKLLVADERNGELLEEVRIANDRLNESNVQLEGQATTDALTGVANRRAFDKALAAEWRRSERAQRPVSLLIVDIDRFKLYNDSFGHQAGDKCLRSIATAMSQSVRESTDLVARYGGEEFAVILPDTDAASGLVVAEKIRAIVFSLGIDRAKGDPNPVTVSVGLATQIPAGNAEPSALVAAADEALYAAKDTGRNRVCSSGHHPQSCGADQG